MTDVSSISSVQNYYLGYYRDTSEVSDDFGKDDFYKLISAQLKYQNPMEPVDNVDFLSQTAQFNVLEQLANLNSEIQCLIYSQGSLYANSLIGKEISWLDDNLELREGIVERVIFSGDGLQVVVDGTGISLSSIVSVSETAETAEEGSTE